MKLTRTRERIAWILWGLALATLVAGSLLPGLWVERMGLPVSRLGDKFLHYSGYCLLSIWPAFSSQTVRRRLRYAAGMITLGIIVELTQRMVPGRSVDLLDLHANNLGVFTGTMVGWLIRATVRL